MRPVLVDSFHPGLSELGIPAAAVSRPPVDSWVPLLVLQSAYTCHPHAEPMEAMLLELRQISLACALSVLREAAGVSPCNLCLMTCPAACMTSIMVPCLNSDHCTGCRHKMISLHSIPRSDAVSLRRMCGRWLPPVAEMHRSCTQPDLFCTASFAWATLCSLALALTWS